MSCRIEKIARGLKSLMVMACLFGIAVKAHSQQDISVTPNVAIDQEMMAKLVRKAEENAKQHEVGAKKVMLDAQQQATAHIKNAEILVKNVDKRMKSLKFDAPKEGSKLSDGKGINIEHMLGKYFSKYQQSKEGHNKIPELMVFVSLSMPERGLRELGEQVIKAGGVLVIRGMLDQSLSVTIKKIHALNQKGLPIIIHPTLFRKFEVKAVPTIALVDRKNAFCLEAKSECTPVADRITGNVNISYALELFASSGDYQAKAKEYLNRLRGKA